jgi:hypothetical protein
MFSWRVIRDGRLLPSRMNCGKPSDGNSTSETRLARRLALPYRLENECLVAARLAQDRSQPSASIRVGDKEKGQAEII